MSITLPHNPRPVELVQHHVIRHRRMFYTFSIHDRSMEHYLRDHQHQSHPVQDLTVEMRDLVARYELLGGARKRVQMMNVVLLYIEEHFGLEPHEVLIHLCQDCQYTHHPHERVG